MTARGRAEVLRRKAAGAVRTVPWTVRQHRQARRGLAREGSKAMVRDSGPLPPRGALPIITAILRVRGATCLERSLILQQWLMGHGRAHDIVIGVKRGPDAPVMAHAWLDGIEQPSGYLEVHRLDPVR